VRIFLENPRNLTILFEMRYIPKIFPKSRQKKKKKAGAELCQAQKKLRLV
jgi:hypothetical protein